MPTSSDPTETADIGNVEQRHTAQANHLARIARMAQPFGYSLVDDVALERLRSEAAAARTMRQAIGRFENYVDGVTDADLSPDELRSWLDELEAAAVGIVGQPDPPAAA
jgi:hypothetical protein